MYMNLSTVTNISDSVKQSIKIEQNKIDLNEDTIESKIKSKDT